MREAHRVTPLLASTLVSVTGDGAFLAAAPLLAVTLTTNAIAVSAVSAACYVPWLLTGLPAGAMVDRWHRRTTMLTADVLRFGLLGLLTVLVFTNRLTLPVLLVLVALVCVAQAFFDSAAQAFIPTIVGREPDVLARVNGRFWTLDTVGRSLVGPPLGSLTFTARHAVPFALDAVSFAVSAVLVRRLPVVHTTRPEPENVVAAIRAGLRHLLGTRELRIMATATAGYNFGYNLATATLVLYVSRVLGVGSTWYGVLLAAGAVGGVAGGLLAPWFMRQLPYRQAMAAATSGQAVSWLGVAATRDAWLAGLGFVLVGTCSAVASVVVGSARQAMTPDRLLGRVVTAYRGFSLGAAGLGAVAGGLIADRFSLTAPLVVAAVLLLCCSGYALWPRPRLMRTWRDRSGHE